MDIANINIRPANLSDIPTLRIFEQGVIAAERPFDDTLGGADIHYYDLEIMLASPTVLLLVAERNGQLIGSGYARKEEAKHYLRHTHHAYLGFMYVEPAYRGKGVNGRIIQALEQWVKEQGITELRLDVYQPNDPAIKAYEKMGFAKHMILMRKGI